MPLPCSPVKALTAATAYNPTMVAGAGTNLEQEPGWPGGEGRPTVILTDAASKVELRIVESWIERNRPRSTPVETLRIPPSRRRKPNQRPDARLAARLHRGDNPLVVPIRVVWTPAQQNGRRTLTLRDFLTLRDPRDPDVVTQHLTLRRNPDRVHLALGDAAAAGELRSLWDQSVEAVPFEDYVARRAWLALERAERRLRGTRYKIPKFVREEILSRGDFQDGLARIAPEVGRPLEQMTRKSRRYLKEIAASHSPFMIDLVASGIRLLYRQGYGHINYDSSQFQELYTLGARYPLVFLPSHKSNLDHLVLQYLLWENNLPPNHTAGGINMNFFPVGPIIRRTGVFFIRRTFKDNPTYKFVLRSYLEYLIEKRFPLEWYVEGGRSRSGKLLAPKYGMLVYVADALRNRRADDVYLIPTSITYDHIQEISAYAAEEQGQEKTKESAAWMVKVIRSLRKRYGNIHLRFGEPLSLAKELDPSLEGADRHLDIQKVAFEVAVRINRVTPVTPTSLATVALLAHPERAQNAPELASSISDLVDEIEGRGLPSTVPLGHLRTDRGVREVMSGLGEHGIVDIVVDGPETIYRIKDGAHLGASFYRNTVIHFFVNQAIAELALVAARTAPGEYLDAFWAEVANLRDLLKFEFFFPEREEFREEIHQALSDNLADWAERVASGVSGIDETLASIRPIHAPWALRSFLEAYDVAGQTLQHDPRDGEFSEKQYLADALARGKQYQLQRRITAPDAVSQSLFKTALQLATNRDLIDESSSMVASRRAEFAEEVRGVLSRLAYLDELVARRQSPA